MDFPLINLDCTNLLFLYIANVARHSKNHLQWERERERERERVGDGASSVLCIDLNTC